MKNQQGAPEALRPIARYKIGYTTDDWGMRSSTPSGIPHHAGAWVRYEDHVAALVEAQQPAKAESLRQILTDPENQPNQYGVQFLMHDAKMAFRIGNRQFCLDYEPDEPGEFEFMCDALISAFSIFTPDVKLAQQPAAHVQNPAEIERVAGDAPKTGPKSNMTQPAPSAAADLHPKTAHLVQRFAAALAEKLAAAEKKYGYSDGWASPDWMDECRLCLREHLFKGDPRDVAAYCAFLWHHGESTALPSEVVEDRVKEFEQLFPAPQPSPTPQADSAPSEPAKHDPRKLQLQGLILALARLSCVPPMSPALEHQLDRLIEFYFDNGDEKFARALVLLKSSARSEGRRSRLVPSAADNAPQADSAPVAICNACGAELLEVKQSPNSYLSAEQFDADKLGDWYCKCCPKGPSEGSSTHRYFWNRDLGAAAPQADSQPAPNKEGFWAWWEPYQLPDGWIARVDLVAWHAWQAATIAARAPADSVTAPAGGEIDRLRAALVYVAYALHDTPKYMLAEGITLIDGDTVRVSRDGWTVEASVNPARATPPAQAADSGLEDAASAGFFLQLPQRPKPEAPAGTVGLGWDAYSGAQMLAYGRDCSNAAIVATQKPGGV